VVFCLHSIIKYLSSRRFILFGMIAPQGLRYIFGTSFDETHKDIAEKDLVNHPLRPVHDIPEHEREKVLKQRRHGTLKVRDETKDGQEMIRPKPFGAVEEHPLDGGVVPPKVVHVDPFFLDANLVTNKDYGKFVRATYHETEVSCVWTLICFVHHSFACYYAECDFIFGRFPPLVFRICFLFFKTR
jgi:hypothetical protein